MSYNSMHARSGEQLCKIVGIILGVCFFDFLWKLALGIIVFILVVHICKDLWDEM